MSLQARREKADLPLATLIDMFILSKQIEGRGRGPHPGTAHKFSPVDRLDIGKRRRR